MRFDPVGGTIDLRDTARPGSEWQRAAHGVSSPEIIGEGTATVELRYWRNGRRKQLFATASSETVRIGIERPMSRFARE